MRGDVRLAVIHAAQRTGSRTADVIHANFLKPGEQWQRWLTSSTTPKGKWWLSGSASRKPRRPRRQLQRLMPSEGAQPPAAHRPFAKRPRPGTHRRLP